MSGDSFVELAIDGIKYIGEALHWLAFIGKKPFSKVTEYRLINSDIGIAAIIFIVTIIFLFFKDDFLNLILNMINKKLKHN